MVKISIDPHGGEPYGAPKIASNDKQANTTPEQIPMQGPDSNISGLLSGPKK